MLGRRLAHRVVAVLAALSLGATLAITATSGVSGAAGTKATLVVGSIASTNGSCLPQASNDVPTATSNWATYVNKHGGIAGHKVQVIQYNDNCDPGQSTADAQKLIAAHVLAIFDNTEFDSAWDAAVQSAGIPVICGIETGNNPNCFTNSNSFPTGATVLAGLYGNVAAAKLAGAKSFAVVYCTEVAACAQALPLFSNYSKQVGLTYVNPLAASETAPSYTAQCVEFNSEHADAVFPAGPPSDKFAVSCAQQGYHPIITQSAGTWLNRYLKVSALNNSTGTYPNVPWTLTSTPTEKAFHAAEGKLINSSYSPYNVSGAYAAGLLFQTAAAQVSATPTTQDIYNGLYAASGTTLGGFAPPLTFTKGKPGSVSCFFIVSIKKGKFVAPLGGKTKCQPSS
jgi:branched-chain amino acid transport system substrate-binding protein